jgi:predicted SAM-dependent methyltransferase
MKINLGCGNEIEEGYINIDKNPLADDVWGIDLEKACLPFTDESVSKIEAVDVLEHITNLIPLMNECHRILEPRGLFFIEVPEFPHKSSISDPTHVRYFNSESFLYFTRYKGAQIMYNIKKWNLKMLKVRENRVKVLLEK